MEDFEKIYLKYFNHVYKYVCSLCHNESLAEEITQETFYKAIKNADKYKGECTLYVWLCQIAKNTFYTYAKKQKRYNSDEIDFNNIKSKENNLDKLSLWEIHKQLHDLEEPYKEVFTLRIFTDLPFSQIGELFGKSDSWARLIYHRAKLKIRRKLDEDIM